MLRQVADVVGRTVVDSNPSPGGAGANGLPSSRRRRSDAASANQAAQGRAGRIRAGPKGAPVLQSRSWILHEGAIAGL